MSTDQARVVVIGGGITGCSVAYHLALAGWTDVLLVEKAQLTAGSTCQAAGLVTAFNPSSTMMAFRRYSIELYGRLGAFEPVGSLRLASSPDQLRELERTASRARGIGLEAEVIGADEARRLMPAISPDALYGAVHLAGDGYLDPHGATHAVADAARALGVRIRTGLRVTGIELSARREVKAVLTEDGPIATEIVVNAAGMWAPQVAAMVGAFIPSTPVDHQHVALKAVPGHELPRDMPCFRDPDNLVYGKSEQGGMVFGGYETDPVSRWEDGVPWDHAARSLPPDWERFAPLMAGAIRRFPFLADAEAIRLVCHPDAMTPDANPLLGPLPGVRGFWVAAGLSLNGFGGGGGIGRAIAGWITAGDPGVDIGPYRAWRFGEVYRDTGFAAGLARETYSDYYRLRYPFDADVAGRPKRRSALHGRLQEAGAVFGTKAGWERADHHEPGRPWRRSGRDQAAYGWTKPPWFERVLAEGRAVRERAGIVDLSSFGKIAVEGPGALGLLQRVSANDIDRPVGSLIYTQWCDERGGIVADVTVTRLADDRFRVVTGAGYLASEMAWLRTHLADDDGPVAIRDDSAALTTIGLWGPRARDILAAVSLDDVGDAAIPLRRARSIRRRAGARPGVADQLRGRARLGADHRCRMGGRRMGRPHGGRSGARTRAIRLPGARRAPDGEGLPLLRHGPDHARHARRGGTRRLRPARRRARSSAVTRWWPRAPLIPTGRSGDFGPSSSAMPSTCRSTAARRSATRARSSDVSAASPTGRPSSARSRMPICPPGSSRERTSRSMSSTGGSARSWPRTSSSIRPAIRMRG